MGNSMCEEKAMPMEDIKVLAAYNEQKKLLNIAFKCMAKKLKLPRFTFPEVRTMDQFQSKQAFYIIVDPTQTDKLGYMDSENRMNMGAIRA